MSKSTCQEFKKSFKFDEDACSGSNEEEVTLPESDQNDKEKTREINETPEQSSYKESNRVSCKSNNKEEMAERPNLLLAQLTPAKQEPDLT